jgi:hypothetical protein
MNKLRTDAKHYRIQSDVAQNLLKKAKAEKTDQSHLIFDLASSPIKYNELTQLRGCKGIMKLSNLEVQSDIEQHDTLILTGLVDGGRVISEENIRNLFSLSVHTDRFSGADQEDLKKQHQKNKKDKLDNLEKTDSAFMQREFTKFERWADDKIRALEVDLKEDRQKIRDLEREQHKENILGQELIELQEKISKIKRKYNRLRQEIYDREDEINEQRDTMIKEAKNKLTRTIKEEELFTVSFEII